MELKDLVGRHFLSGVDYEKEFNDDDATVMNFILDGTTYTAGTFGRADDGYRSTMRDIQVSRVTIKNTFRPIEVYCWMEDDILNMKCAANGKLILSVGTDYSDNYYPSFVAYFRPEDIPIESSVITGRMLRPYHESR